MRWRIPSASGLNPSPRKILFATDAYPYIPEMGWEESGWIAARTGRQALAIALTGMMRDNEITRARVRLPRTGPHGVA